MPLQLGFNKDATHCLVCVYSRAHTIVAISFIQKGKNAAGQMMTKTSIVNLVDLAGR